MDTPFKPLREGVEYYDATEFETAIAQRLDAATTRISELEQRVQQMAENQLRTLQHIATLTERLEKPEEPAKSRIILPN